MAPNKTDFRWTPEEEAWLLMRVIDDAGRSKKNGTQAQWTKSIVSDFEDEFPCRPRSKVGGAVETGEEMMQRWNENPRRIRRWIGNHQKSVLRKHVENKPQNLLKRLAPKRTKNSRSKNARDMAKAHDPDLKAKWTDLHQQFKDGKITKSERFEQYNKAVTVLLKDEHKKTNYTAVASRQDPTQRPSASTETEKNACSVLTLPELQIVQYTPSLSMSTATEANAVRAQYNEPEAHLEHDERQADFDDSHREVRDEGAVSGEPFLTPHQPVQRDDAEAMLVDSTGQGSNADPIPDAYDGVPPVVVISPGNPPQPTPYTTQQTTFGDTSLPSFDMATDMSGIYPRFGSHANEWLLREVASPRILEAPQSTQSYPHPVIGHAYNTTSSSLAHSLGIYHQPPAQASYVHPSTYDAPPLPEVAVNSYADQSDPPHTTQSHNSSSIDTHSTSSNAAAVAHNRFKDWSPAGDWHLQKVFRGHDGWVNCLAFSHNGKLLASGSDDRTIIVRNVETGETVLGPLKGHTDRVRPVAFSPDDRRIVSGSDDCTIRIWDVQTGKQLFQFEEHISWIWSVAFSSDGSRVASSDVNDHISIWDVDSKRIRHLEQPEHEVLNIHFSSDDRFIAAAGYGNLSIWDVESGKQVSTSLQAGSFGDLFWFEHGTMYTLIDKKIRRWSEDETFILGWCSTLSPDRKCIASRFYDDIYLYSRDPSPEELASVGDIIEDYRQFTLVEKDLKSDP